ncbi:hypothetical protein HPB50_020883 [Hyalomma asiaticum]|uniref:Uncharacterized protein n=1 Tax=Hyalomma asiaticum TaxID=266040 RepID=A0ACB7TB83_HYAAI|nr:hypothetical protein HPB50_020883 [Hyalomma asiaticum]
MHRGTTPPRMPVSLDHCPENVTFRTSASSAFNATWSSDDARSEEFFLFRVSYYWISFFGIFVIVALGVLVSALTGEMWNKEEQPELCSDLLVRLWRKPTPLRKELLLQVNEVETSRFDKHNGGVEVQDLLTRRRESHV